MSRPDWIDDPSIPDEARLWRGIPPESLRPDPRTGQEYPSLGAFVTGELSVNIADETTYADVLAKGAMRGVVWRLWEFTARDARNAGCIVGRDPEPGDRSHAVVLRRDEPGKRLKDSQAKRLINTGRWVSAPDITEPTAPVQAGPVNQ